MSYVLFWLSEKAAQHTESHFSYKSSVTDLYQTAAEILKDLKNIYKDFNKLRNYCCVYIKLI